VNNATKSDVLFKKAITAHKSGDLAQAEEFYKQLLKQRPDYSSAWINLGQLQRKQGKDTEAIGSYQHASKLPKPPVELFFNLGNLYLAQSKFEKALVEYKQVLQLYPDHLAALQQKGMALRMAGRLQEASDVFGLVLHKTPNHHASLLERGNIERALRRPESAKQSYQQLVHHYSDDWKSHYAMARLLFDLKEVENGQGYLNRAIELSKDPAEVLQPLAQSFISEGRYSEAYSVLQQLLQAAPNHLATQLQLGKVLVRLGRSKEANALFQQLSTSTDIGLLTQLANVLMDINEWQPALTLLRRVIELEPQCIDGYLNLASGCVTAWQLNEALTVLEQNKAVIGEHSALPALMGSIHSKRGDIESALNIYRKELSSHQNKQSARLNFASLYSDQLTSEDNFQQHLCSAAQQQQGVTPVQRWANNPNPDRPLRIGYVTADLHHQHPVDIYLQPVFSQHDQSQYSVTIYYNGVGYDDRTRRAKGLVAHWHEVYGWPDERLHCQIESDQIDILIDLSGHTNRNRLSLFARHPAPLQVAMVAYPHTTGLDAMDYILGDPILTPPEQAHLYSEQLLRLDRCIFCYPADLHPVNAPRDERDEVIFGSFNNVPKLTPSTIRIWAKILHQVANSKLLLKAPSFQDSGCVERYQGLFLDAGVSAGRLIFRGPTSLDQMMREYRDMDIALDPFPFNGGTTSQQALWAGTPLVSLAGASFNQRMGASILSHLGRPEWVARSEEEYVQIAVNLASDKTRLREIHRILPQQMQQSVLTDSYGYTRNLERLLRRIWRQWCTKQAGERA
jgi:predicted O-linked N-acetylglucosamine transferase (SPINDLY family)